MTAPDALTEKALAEIEGLLEGMTPGRWEHRQHEGLHAIAHPNGWVLENERDDGPDFAGLVALRNAAPALIAEVRKGRMRGCDHCDGGTMLLADEERDALMASVQHATALTERLQGERDAMEAKAASSYALAQHEKDIRCRHNIAEGAAVARACSACREAKLAREAADAIRAALARVPT